MNDPTNDSPTAGGDERFNWDLIIDVLDVLERHGYHQVDDQHTGRAIGILGNLVEVYEGRA